MAADLPSGMIAVIFHWAAKRATDPKDVRRGKAEPGGDRPSPSEVGMCGVPSPVRAVHQHSLTREGERLIPMVFALPAVVVTPANSASKCAVWVSLAVQFFWGPTRGGHSQFFLGVLPGEDAVNFSLTVLQVRTPCNLVWPLPGGMLPDFAWSAFLR